MIRINLLAEAQAAEEQRRKDPAKRAILASAVLVALVLAYAGLLELRVMNSVEALRSTESRWQSLAKTDALIRSNATLTLQINAKLDALHKLSTNRFLWSAPLNALQFCMVDNLEVTAIVPMQTYNVNKEERSVDGKQILKAASSKEDISFKIIGNDFAPASDGNHTRFMNTLSQYPYFREKLKKPDPISAVKRTAGVGEGQIATFEFTCQFPIRSR